MQSHIGPFPHRAQMIFKIMNLKKPIGPAHMGQIGGTLSSRLCLSLCFLYNRCMAFDPANPPIWLRKLHVSATQISPTDDATTPEEGILECCRLSDAMQRWSKACAQALGFSPLPPRPPFDNPFRRVSSIDRTASVSRDVAR